MQREGVEVNPRKKCRAYPVFATDGRKIIRRTTRAEGDLLEQAGVWQREYDTLTGALIGYRLVGVSRSRVDADVRSRKTSASITPREMELNVCNSRTQGMSEAARMKRVKDGRQAEDAVERTHAKVAVYRHVTGEVGDILRVWPRCR